MSSNKLATFRVDDEVWQLFQDKAKVNGTNASALLQRFVKDYLDDSIDRNLDKPMVESEAIADLQSQISNLRTAINLELVEIKTSLATTHNLASEAMIANIKTSETVTPEKVKPLALIAEPKVEKPVNSVASTETQLKTRQKVTYKLAIDGSVILRSLKGVDSRTLKRMNREELKEIGLFKTLIGMRDKFFPI